MTVYVVTYDLRKENGDTSGYEDLYDKLKSYSHCRIQDSTWLLATSKTAFQVKTDIASVIDNNDFLWVSSVRKNEYDWSRGYKPIQKFLEENGL